MLASPNSAIDVPPKALLRQELDSVEIAYNSLTYLDARHRLSKELLKNIADVEMLVNKAAE
ncbi:MAG: hypothetical protein WB439_03860 [Acidobacteriaceae bacterium]